MEVAPNDAAERNPAWVLPSQQGGAVRRAIVYGASLGSKVVVEDGFGCGGPGDASSSAAADIADMATCSVHWLRLVTSMAGTI